jgi:hypothetical protein
VHINHRFVLCAGALQCCLIGLFAAFTQYDYEVGNELHHFDMLQQVRAHLSSLSACRYT